jgi:nitroreductase
MDTFLAIKERRSIRHYDPVYKINQAELDQLIDLAAQTPSSFNIQHWRIVNITDLALRQQIRAAAWDQAQVTEASLLFVICADLKAWAKNPAQYFRNAPESVQNILVPMIAPFYEGKEQLQRDEAMRSVGFVAMNLMLAAKAMGYDSSPMIGYDPIRVAELVKLPQDHVVGMMLAIGKKTQDAFPKPGFIAKSTMVIENHF